MARSLDQQLDDLSTFMGILYAYRKLEHSQTISIREGSIRTLLYFDLFNYPLNIDEILKFAPVSSSTKDLVKVELGSLIECGDIYSDGVFYSVRPLSELVERRLKGNKVANKVMAQAFKMSHKISKFPFVRSVMLSGSISKGYMADDGDVDFFVLTEPGRLWLARTFLMLYKKLFLLNSHKYFCINYLITTDQLEIPDKNLFTATEVVTLIPTYRTDLYEQFQAANKWAQDFYPGFKISPTNGTIQAKDGSIKNSLEKVLSGKLGDSIENKCLKMTLNFWKRKFKHFDPETFELALRSNKSTSKHHPRNFQKSVIDSYNERCEQYKHLFEEKKEMAS